MPAMFIWLTFLSLRLLRGAREDRRIAADDLQEADDLANQVVVVGDVIFLVGCVNVVIRQAGAHAVRCRRARRPESSRRNVHRLVACPTLAPMPALPRA